MSSFFLLVFNTILVNNLVLNHLLGLDLQVAASKRMQVAWMVGLATLYYLSLCLPSAYLLNKLFITLLHLQHLELLFYMLLIMIIVLATEQITQQLFPLDYKKLRYLTPLILMNSLLLGSIILMTPQTSFIAVLLFAFCTGLGFLCLLLVVTCLRERANNTHIPKVFKGLPIFMITLGIFSMGLTGLAGLH